MQRGRLMIKYIWTKNRTYTVESAPTKTGSVFMRRFRLFFGQRSGCSKTLNAIQILLTQNKSFTRFLIWGYVSFKVKLHILQYRT